MKTLIVGGNGFIGANLQERFVSEGHEVRVYDRNDSRFLEKLPEVEYLSGEFGDKESIRSAVEGMEIVYHLVSTTLPGSSNDDPAYDVRSNVVGTIQLLESCVEAGTKRVVFISSGGTVYGIPRSVPIFEEHPTEPTCSYGITKLAIEKYLGSLRQPLRP